MNNRFEEFFASCSFCRKPNQLIVFDVAWRGQQSKPSNVWVRGGKVWLCSPCCNRYGQLPNNFEFDKMCGEVMNGTKS